MNANTRVAINAMATYGRTLLRMGLGLFSSRWVLESLGEVDYGLMGVVGLLIVLITFLNTVVTGACARFFAFSIGKNDLTDLIRWFNTGLSVHVFLGVFLVVVGFPFGEWAIDNFLNIPPDRVVTAHWVFRFSLMTAFWTICLTPYGAMYTATQNIVELTLWEIAQIIINFGFVYWLTTYHGDAWLIYSGFMMLLSVSIGMGKAIRARYAFPGCRIDFKYWKDKIRLKQMLSFSGWSLFGSAGYMARAQLPSGLLNKFFNPMLFPFVNASYQIGGALASYTQSMSNSLLGAFTPQITTLAGANEKESMIKTVLRSSKFGTFLTLLFAIPVTIEADHLLILWLQNPPILAATFCKIVILQMVVDNLTYGMVSGIMATGKIKWYQLTTGSICILSIPIAWVVLYWGGDPTSVSWVITACVAVCSFTRLLFARNLLGIPIIEWFKIVFLPIFIITVGSYLLGLSATFILPESFLRICITTILSCTAMFFLGWQFMFDPAEKGMIKRIIGKVTSKINKNSCAITD